MVHPGRKAWFIAVVSLLGIAGLTAAIRARVPVDSEAMAEEVRQALKERQWSRAESLLGRLARQRTPGIDEAVLWAELELGRGRSDRAVELLVGIPGSDDRAAQARLIAGQIEKSRDRARRMESLFLDAIRMDPGLIEARRELIFLYAMQARRGELQAQYRALAEQSPLGFDDVFLWSNSLEDTWVNDRIRPHLERYVAADPDDRASRLALTGVLLHSNELEAAETLLRDLPDSDPDVRTLHARIALGRLRLDEVRSLLDGGPVDHTGLALLRGHFAIQSKNPEEAARQYEIALRLDPNSREAAEGRAAALARLGDEGAGAAQKRAARWRRLTSLLQEAHVHNIRRDRGLLRRLGEVCESLSQLPEARAWYQLALALDPLDPEIQQALYRVRPLKDR